jgi:RNA polymerase sigma factor (sigma-70 family)
MKKPGKNSKEKAAAPVVFKESDQEDLDALNLMNKDPRAFAHFVYKYEEIILIKIGRVVKDKSTAQDIKQDILQKVFLNISKYQKQFTFNAWLTRVTDNYLVDVIRQRKRERQNIVELDAAFGLPGGELNDNVYELADETAHKFGQESYEAEHKQAYLKLESLIHQMSALDQAIVKLFYLENKRQGEIAKILNITHVAVRVRINRIKKRLLSMAGENTIELVTI